MPIVTALKRQKRSDTRVNVYLDGAYTFALPDLELSLSGLRVGSELSDEQVAEYRSRAEDEGAYARAVRFMAVRPRSRREVEDYLARKMVAPDVIQEIVGRLMRVGLLDDRAFAESWVANRQLLRPRSRRRLEQELASKGLARDDIQAALEGLEGEAELKSLIEVVEKKQRLPQYHEPQRLVGYLARQGYGYELIKRALEEVSKRSDG